MVVDGGQGLNGAVTLVGGGTTDEHTVGALEVGHGSALSEELRVAEHGERRLSGAMEHGGDGLGSLNRDGGLLDDDLGRLGDRCNSAGGELPVGEVSCASGADAILLRWRIHSDEDDVGLLDCLVHLGSEEQVLSSALLDDLVEARLVDWQAVRVPRGDSGLRDVHNGHGRVRALLRNLGHRRSADISGSHTADLHVCFCITPRGR
mmetsp:Transcript_2340/g.7011  ORF Transcript_2340/g.7011 Transcript_2340/m.7011 type:complete len:206 (-) Transcript_2340:79-696(-)